MDFDLRFLYYRIYHVTHPDLRGFGAGPVSGKVKWQMVRGKRQPYTLRLTSCTRIYVALGDVTDRNVKSCAPEDTPGAENSFGGFFSLNILNISSKTVFFLEEMPDLDYILINQIN